MRSLFTDLPKLSSKPPSTNVKNTAHSDNKSSASKKRKLSGIELIIYTTIFFFICGISAGVGYATFAVAHSPQKALFQIQFNSVITQLQISIQTGLKQKFAGSSLMGKMFAWAAKYGYGTSHGTYLVYQIMNRSYLRTLHQTISLS